MVEYRGKIPFLLNEYKKNIIYLCSSNKNLEDYYQVLLDIYNGKVIKFENIGEEEELLKTNYDFLKVLKSGENYITLLSLESFLKDYFLEGEKITLELGKIIDVKEFENKIIGIGYKKEYMIEERKQYSIRGDIVDIFPLDSEYPIRIEIDFDDRIERIAYFDLESQRSIHLTNKVDVYINNNKEKKSFLSLIENLDEIEFFVENRELLNYKLEEIILRNRDEENLLRTRYLKIKNLGQDINIIKFSNEEIDRFSNYDYIKEMLENNEINIKIVSDEAKRYEEIFQGYENIIFERYPLFEGYRESNLLVLTDRELKGIRVKRESKEKSVLRYKNVSEIREGDYIIHENYGVGLYLGIEIIDGNEYLKIKYADEDKLYVPVEGIGRIEKYISAPGVIPEIYNLGRRGFKRKKEKLYEEMLVFAKEIIEVQAKRQMQIGYRFSGDTVWQEESQWQRSFLISVSLFHYYNDNVQYFASILALSIICAGLHRPNYGLVFGIALHASYPQTPS